MKKIFFLFVIVFSIAKIQAQSITPDVIGATGDNYSNATAMVSFTVGEIMVETFSNANNIITQGFHQPPILSTSVENIIPTSNEIVSYPNPSNGIFTIKSEIKISNIEIANVLGEKIYSAQISSDIKEIDLSNQPNGIYFITIKTEQGTTTKKINIQK